MKRLLALGFDVVLVFAFAFLGRSSHGEGLALADVARTAMPFVAALLLAWILLVTRGASGFALRDGAVIWVLTVAMGVVLRLLLGETAAWSFIVVTAAVLGAMLFGWRLVLWLVGRHAPGGEELVTSLTGGPRRARSGSAAKDPRRSGNPAVRASARKKP